MTGISKSQVSRLCEDIDERVKPFLSRPIEGDWPYLWIDATYVKVRESGRIVSVAVIVAVGQRVIGSRHELNGTSHEIQSNRFPAELTQMTPAGALLGRYRIRNACWRKCSRSLHEHAKRKSSSYWWGRFYRIAPV